MPIPALIGAIGAMASTAIGAYANHQANKKLADQQYKQNKDMWTLQNQYNSPSSQAARYKAAGLNPALAYGGSPVVAGNADTAPQLDYAGAMSSPKYDMPGAFGSFSQMFTNSKTDAETANIRANTARTLKLTDPELKKLNTDILYTESLTDKTKTEIDRLQKDIELTDLSIDEKRTTNEILEKTKQFRIKEYSLQNDLTDAEIREVRKKTAMYDEQINNFIADTKLKVAQRHVAESQKYNVEAQTEVYKEQVKEIAERLKQFKPLVKKLTSEANLTGKEADWFEAKMFLQVLTSCLSALN